MFAVDTKDIEAVDININNSVSNKISNDGGLSIFRFKIGENRKDIVVKVKNADAINKYINMFNVNKEDKFIDMCLQNLDIFEFTDSYKRESEVLKNIDARLQRYTPVFIGSAERGKTNTLISEYFEATAERVFDEDVLIFLSKLHAVYFNRPDIVEEMGLYCPTQATLCSAKPLLSGMIRTALDSKSVEFSDELRGELIEFADNIDAYIADMQKSYMTLNHGDFSYRNICYKTNGDLCVYDWELARHCHPLFDLITYMCYDDHDTITKSYVKDFLKSYCNLVRESGFKMDDKEFIKALDVNLKHFFVFRVVYTTLINNTIPRPLSNLLSRWLKLYNMTDDLIKNF